jgi:endonuclease-3
VEDALRRAVPAAEQLAFCHRLVAHGRAGCRARCPLCGECTLREWCACAK